MNSKHEVLVGPYRGGKSWFLLEQAVQNCLTKIADKNKADLNSETIIIVPSQRYRKLVERRLKKLLDKRNPQIESVDPSRTNLPKQAEQKNGLWGLKILTFYQFCQASLFQAGIFSKMLPDAAKGPLLAAVCKKLSQSGKIETLAPILNSSGTQASILSLIDEWQRSGYTAADILKKIEQENKQNNVEKKEHKTELAQIYAAYTNALADIKCLDDHDLVFKLIEILNRENNITWLNNFVIVDGFDRFNSLQIQLLKALAKHVETLYIGFDYEQPANNLFEEYAWKSRSFEQMTAQLADSFSFKAISSSTSSDEGKGNKDSDCAGNSNIDSNHNQSAKINSFATSDRLAETAIIAARVKSALVLENIKPDQIVVTARSLALYKPAFEAAFKDAGVDYYIDEPIAMKTLPIVHFLTSLLSISEEDFSRRQIIDCLRSPYFKLRAFGLSPIDVEKLNTLSLNKKIVAGTQQWNQALKAEPRLAKILDTIFSQLSLPESATSAIAYVSWVEDIIDKVLDLSIIEEYQEPLLVWKQKQALVQFRRQLAALIQEEEILRRLKQDVHTGSHFERLEQLIENANFPGPSYNNNQVLITSAELIPNQKYKQIYLAGLLEGEFPAIKTNSGFLAPQQIEQWRRLGVYIYNPRFEPGFEYALFASLINRAEDKIVLSYPEMDINASKNELVPSFFLTALNLLPEDSGPQAISFANQKQSFNSPRNALAYTLWHDQAIESIKQFNSPVLKGFVDQLQEKLSFAEIRSHRILNSPVNGYLLDHVAASTVKVNLPEYWSAGHLNDYGKCSFNFWVTRMLKSKPHEEPAAGLSVQDRGTFYHKALEIFYKNIIENKLSIDKESTEVLQKYFDKAVEEAFIWLEEQPWFRPDEFWTQEKNTLVFRLNNFFAIEQERFIAEDGQYMPYLTEVAFGPDDIYPPLVLNKNGREIKIRGKIDRIDIETDSPEQNKKLRLIDYKSGSTFISKDDFESGRNIQLPLYALAVEQSITPGSKINGYQYLSINTSKALSAKTKDEIDIRADLNILQNKIFEFVEKIEKGDFSVNPSNDKVCSTCVHIKVCRIKEFPNRVNND